MHYAKYQKGAVGSILLHSDRGIDGPDTHEHSNGSIDKTRTHLNYDLKDRGGLTAYEYYKKRIDDIASETKERTGKSIRKDAVTLCSWAVTAPKDLPEEKIRDFFKASYAWFAERYGADNIVTAAVHMDEVTPHMHLQFTPIIEKDGVRRLCAKDMETRKTLKMAHKELREYLEQSLECKVNILNGATVNGNKSIEKLKLEQLQEESKRLKSENEKLEQKALAYKTPSKKQFFETKENYSIRVAVEQKQLALESREANLSKRESDFDAELERTAKQYVYKKGVEEVAKVKEQQQKAENETLRIKYQTEQEVMQMQAQIVQLEQENEKMKNKIRVLETRFEEWYWEFSDHTEMLSIKQIVPELYEDEIKRNTSEEIRKEQQVEKKKRGRGYELEL